jgi:hypothetical protein
VVDCWYVGIRGAAGVIELSSEQAAQLVNIPTEE